MPHQRPLQGPELFCAGTSDVYVTGYKTTSSILPGQYPYFDGEDSSDEDEDEDEEDEPPPQAVPLTNKRRAALIAVRSLNGPGPCLWWQVQCLEAAVSNAEGSTEGLQMLM